MNSSEDAWSLLYEALEYLFPWPRSTVRSSLSRRTSNVLKTQGQLIGSSIVSRRQHLQVVCDPYNYSPSQLASMHEEATERLLDRFEPRFVLAHLKDVDPRRRSGGTPEFGTGAFSQLPYLEFLRSAAARPRPDRRAHAARARVEVRRRLDDLIASGEERAA